MNTNPIEFDIILDPDPIEGVPRPARVEFRSADLGGTGGIDPTTIEVRDLETGERAPCRWEDLDALPDPFDDVQGYWTDGVAPTGSVMAPGMGRLYNIAAPGRHGRLVILHRARRRPTTYRVRVRRRAPGETYRAVSRPWIGDGDPLFVQRGGWLGGMLHARPALCDLGRGGPDLLVGNILGHMLHFPYEGDSPDGPYVTGTFLEADGARLDVGWYAAPVVWDWNGDGKPDLLVGQGGHVIYYENVGTAKAWKLELRGPVEADGQPISIPFDFHSKYPYIKKEYIAAPTVFDGNGDGVADLIIGGYLTGLIFHYKSVGTRSDGTPELTDAGYLTADGEIIDVGWAAAPTFGDFRGTGLPSMITGMMDPPGLLYYENVGTRTKPELTRKPLHIEGPEGEALPLGLTYPCPWDLNGDGRLDLCVGAGTAIHLLENLGGDELTFRSGGPLRQPWGPDLFWVADGFRDDRGPAFIAGNDGASLMVRRRDPETGVFLPERMLTSGGKPIYRCYPDRDPWNAPYLRDIDGDGKMELLMGDSVGNVWLHRSIGEEFDQGVPLKRTDGRPVNVGLDPNVNVTDWTSHVGDRSDPVGIDLDGDGVWELLVGDAHGKVTLFDNVGTNSQPVFAEGQVLFEGQGRVTIAAADWDGDGAVEIFATWSSGDIRMFKRSATEWEARQIEIPWIPYPHPIVIDLDGRGEPDLILSGSYGFVHWFRRSFVEYGYNEGRVRIHSYGEQR